MLTHNPLTIEQLAENPRTKGEHFADFKEVFDWAMPQDWIDEFAYWCESNRPRVTYHLIVSSTVWAAPAGLWQPATCCVEVAEAYEAMTRQFTNA